MVFGGAITRQSRHLHKVRDTFILGLRENRRCRSHICVGEMSVVDESSMAENSSSHPAGASQQQLDLILNGDYINVFHAQDYFSVGESIGHVFDVVGGNGIMRSNVSGDDLVEIVKVS